MKLVPVAVFSVVVACFSSQAMAGGDSGLYVGGAVGSTSFSGLNGYDESDKGTKIFAGYNVGLVPFLDISVEGGYTDFGSSEGDSNGVHAELSASSLSAVGLVGAKLGLLGLYGKMGFAKSDYDITVGSASDSDSSTDPIYGIGAKLQFSSLAVRAEYERYDGDVDLDFISLGAYFTF